MRKQAEQTYSIVVHDEVGHRLPEVVVVYDDSFDDLIVDFGYGRMQATELTSRYPFSAPFYVDETGDSHFGSPVYVAPAALNRFLERSGLVERPVVLTDAQRSRRRRVRRRMRRVAYATMRLAVWTSVLIGVALLSSAIGALAWRCY